MREAIGIIMLLLGFTAFGVLCVPGMKIMEKIIAVVIFGAILAAIVCGIYLVSGV